MTFKITKKKFFFINFFFISRSSTEYIFRNIKGSRKQMNEQNKDIDY